MSAIVNAFHHAGVWSVNPNVCKSKVAPATLYCASEKVVKNNAEVNDEQSKVHVGLHVLLYLALQRRNLNQGMKKGMMLRVIRCIMFK